MGSPSSSAGSSLVNVPPSGTYFGEFEIKYTKLFINNEFVDAINKKTFPTMHPSSAMKITEVAEADKDDVDAAVDAAKAACAPDSLWRIKGENYRRDLMNKLADLIARDHEYIARLETLDSGARDSVADQRYAVEILNHFARWADDIRHENITEGGALHYLHGQGGGVVGIVIQHRCPIAMIAWKLAPYLATGYTAVVKPAEQTPLSPLYFGALAKEAGFPPGVINVVTGYSRIAGAAITTHKQIDKIVVSSKQELKKLTDRLETTDSLAQIEDEMMKF